MTAEQHASRAGASYAAFVRAVAEAGAWLPADAEDYALAVIVTLEELLPIREVFVLEAQLPRRLHERLAQVPILDLPAMERRAFAARVAQRLGLGVERADAIVWTVFRVLRSRVSSGEGEKVAQRLPDDLRVVWNGVHAARPTLASSACSSTTERILVRTMAGAEFSTTSDAARAIAATLSALGEIGPPDLVSCLRRELPPDLAVRLEAVGSDAADFTLERLYERVARREHVTVAVAREHVLAICAVVGAELPDSGHIGLRGAAPPELAALFRCPG